MRTLNGGYGRLFTGGTISMIAFIAFVSSTIVEISTSTTTITPHLSIPDEMETFDDPQMPQQQPTASIGSSASASVPTSIFPFVCPEKCSCKTMQSSTSAAAAADASGVGLKVKCGAAHRIASLKDIDFGAMRSEIQHLDLSRNQIGAVDAGDFVNFTALRKLDLSGNVLVSIERDAFGELASLERLKLANNAIVHVFQGAFDGMAQLKLM